MMIIIILIIIITIIIKLAPISILLSILHVSYLYIDQELHA